MQIKYKGHSLEIEIDSYSPEVNFSIVGVKSPEGVTMAFLKLDSTEEEKELKQLVLSKI